MDQHMKNPRGSNRRMVLKASVAAGITAGFAAILPRGVRAAEFNYKFATALDAGHPLNKRAGEALERIRAATSGRVDIKLFPANQLGSDADTLSQTRSGAVEFMTLGHGNLGNYVKSSGIASTGFAFTNYEQVWKAMDGALGAKIRDDVNRTGRIVAIGGLWDNGFRQVTSSLRPVRSPADLAGLKLRVPPNPAYTSLFSALGAGPTPLNYNELYSALQTHVVDGQENPLALINSGKFYEVQKFCSLTNHIWDGFWTLANKDAWNRLPPDLQKIVQTEFARSVQDQRADIVALSKSLQADLSKRGLQFSTVDPAAFRTALGKTRFYADTREKYGNDYWALLEQAVGKLG
ncbi:MULTISPECIES: TRAP transporter substrate-binding protein [unclassified Caballeronia]|uniref:TRAP transporter substrate-binding protein n=1 Tax=unclassified Caballeronia TaxID=2646786 RepID=UPI001F376081|nr:MULTISPECIES: TRAP transporter substrate-binding protein [unclassified Caballeronia]MCE4547272.1 TRAP transporter substrate-binding protein [Caballeronia sp. PC1]MCE4575254.1 TRAP transporter substrate-binding protein [Caballeronia sp. CLC5]MDR5749117.1 TRAP transporter substrate-binding protein [Caballeronia sp. LZ029]